MNRVKRLVQHSLIYNFGNLLPVLLNIILIPLYSRVLTPSDYGVVSLAETVTRILVIILGLGMTTTVTRFYFDLKADPLALRKYLGSVWILLVMVATAVAGLLYWWGKPVLGLFIGDIDLVFHPYLQLAIWTSALAVVPPVLVSLYQAQGKAWNSLLVGVLEFIFYGAAIVYFMVVLDRGAIGSLQGSLWGAAGLLVVALPLIVRTSSFAFNWPVLAQSLKFGLPLIPSALAAWLMTFVDRIILTNISGLAEVGIYSIGYSAAMVMSLIVVGFQRAWLPFFFENADTPQASSLFPKITTWYLAIITGVGLIGALLAKELLSLITTTDYLGASVIIAPVVLGYIFQGLYFLFVTPLLYHKAVNWLFGYTLLAAVVNIGLNLWWIPTWGISGAAWATTIGYAVLAGVTFLAARQRHRLNYEYAKWVWILVVASIAYWLASAYFETSWGLRLIGLVGYVVVLVLTKTINLQQLRSIAKSFLK